MNGNWDKYTLVWLLLGFLSGFTISCGGSASPTIPAAAGESIATPTRPPTQVAAPPTKDPPLGPTVRIDEAEFTVEVADNSEARARGLSGQARLPSGGGMLFVFQESRVHTFWMKGMLFPLDLVWIGEECTVDNITANVPFPTPEQADSDLPRFRPPLPVRYVLEIPGGQAAASQLQVGDPVTFGGSINGSFGC